MALEPVKTFTLEEAHLLARRTMFGATKEQLEQLLDEGLEASLEKLFDYDLAPHSGNPFAPTVSMKDGEQIQATQGRWLFEMIHSEHPFREKLALFWSNHFVVGVDKVRKAAPLLHYLETLYTHGLASFRDLTLAVSQTPALLRYLDNERNKKSRPNENFARELLELFTLGIGNYDEGDVTEAARAFTGWTYKNFDSNPSFFFDKEQHDSLSKTFLGETGDLTGEAVITRCAEHEATAYFVAGKIWRTFVASEIDKPSVRAIARTFQENQGNLRVVFRELFSSQIFYGSSGRLIKSPLDYVVGTLRSLGVSPLERSDYELLRATLFPLGQVPLAPPNVAGWPGGRSWISDSTLLARINWARKLAKVDRLYPPEATPNDLNLALFGSSQNPLDIHLGTLAVDEYLVLSLVSPEYMVS
jgi:uncharacterized protein (DUF1800 family)